MKSSHYSAHPTRDPSVPERIEFIRPESWTRRDFLKTAGAVALTAAAPELSWAAKADRQSLFPVDLPGKQWVQFAAAGFSRPACGVVYRLKDKLTCGMALGAIDTGCLDFENNGLLGYCTIFNSHVPRRGPINLPLFGLAVGDKTWALCRPPDGKGIGEGQPFEKASAWLAEDLGADQPAWKTNTGHVPGWFKSLGKSEYDLPAGRVACHSPIVLRWVSPVTAEVHVEGGLWLARNLGRNQQWELLKGTDTETGRITNGGLEWGPTSNHPLSLAQGSGGEGCLTFRVKQGDYLELSLDGPGDFVGVDLKIRTINGSQVWDLAKDWSETENPNGPWVYDFSRGSGWFSQPFDPVKAGLGLAQEIHYWGHYPVLDVEFETTAPVGVGLRAWCPFLPGDIANSMIPGIIFEMRLRNQTPARQTGTIALTFPGPTPMEAGGRLFTRRETKGDFSGVCVHGQKAAYGLGVFGKEKLRLGGGLDADPDAWRNLGSKLPTPKDSQAGSCAAVDFSLKANETKVLRFALTWSAPTWKGGGFNGASSGNTLTHMYAKRYPRPLETAKDLAHRHASLLKHTLAWQQVVYTEDKLPVWLRDSLVNVLYCITEDGLWAQRDEKLLPWVTEEDGLFGLIECPRCCPQIECIPCSFYGSQPLVYFFPELQLSTMRGYKHYQGEDGRPAWTFGAPVEMCSPSYTQYQSSTNGISLAGVIDRFLMCRDTPDKKFAKEFYPVIKRTMEYNVNLGVKGNPQYTLGEQVMAVPNIEGNLEWFETQSPGWNGVAAHIGILRLAQLGISQRLAEQMGDTAFARQCAEWTRLACDTLEKRLWDPRGYYLNWNEPTSGKKSELVFAYQLDGEWTLQHHGLKSPLPTERVSTVLNTIRKINFAVTKYGAVNYANPDGSIANPGGYGNYSYFPPEALMLAMTYMYAGQCNFGLELARIVWHNIVCRQGYTWDLPNIMRGDADTGERTFGNDYYQDMMLWSLPAAIEGKDFGAPAKRGGLVDRMLKAARVA